MFGTNARGEEVALGETSEAYFLVAVDPEDLHPRPNQPLLPSDSEYVVKTYGHSREFRGFPTEEEALACAKDPMVLAMAGLNNKDTLVCFLQGKTGSTINAEDMAPKYQVCQDGEVKILT